jgi:glycosyltransferase involved in cell wall biosynthesis
MFKVAVPLKVFEYMAGKIPIVATNHAMYTNILAHKKTGYLTETDPESFAQGVLDVIKDRDLQKSMADNARVDVENYSIQKLVDQLESVYCQLLERT